MIGRRILPNVDPKYERLGTRVAFSPSGGAKSIWTPDSSYVGSSEFKSLIYGVDWLSKDSPYITEKKTRVIGPGSILTIQKLEFQTGLETVNGEVYVDPPGVGCVAPSCDFNYPNGQEITLTAKNAGGWIFKQWRLDSEVCPDSDVAACNVTMDSNKTAKAEFMESFNYTMYYIHEYCCGYEAPIVGDVSPGGSLTVRNGLWYKVGVKLDGQEIQISGAHSTWGTGLFTRYDFPDIAFGPDDQTIDNYSFTVRDETNNRDVVIPMDITISNEGYRDAVGGTLILVNDNTLRYIDGMTVTIHPCEEGSQSGTATTTVPGGWFPEEPGETSYEGTWFMNDAPAFHYTPCSDGIGGTILYPLVYLAFMQLSDSVPGGLQTPKYVGVDGEHALFAQPNLTCPEVAEQVKME